MFKQEIIVWRERLLPIKVLLLLLLLPPVAGAIYAVRSRPMKISGNSDTAPREEKERSLTRFSFPFFFSFPFPSPD
jgi:hypothetical protein